MTSPAGYRGVIGSTLRGAAIALPMHFTSALAQEYPAMEAPPDYVEQQREQQHSACILTGACDQPGRAPPPPLPDVWGALAVSASTLNWGASWNYKDEATAASNALSRCRANGASDCKLAVTVADVCVSLATSPAQKLYSLGGPIGAANYADDAALRNCRHAGGQSCGVVTSFCADGIHHVVNGHTEFSNGNPIFVPDQPGSRAAAARPALAAHAGDDTVRFYGTWTASAAVNGQQVTLLSVHDAQGYSNSVVANTGNIPAGSGTFSAAGGRYATSAEKPNDSGSYRFLDSETVECTNAAGQTLVWKRQRKPDEQTAPPVTPPGNMTKK